jgi:hypothetical protein
MQGASSVESSSSHHYDPEYALKVELLKNLLKDTDLIDAVQKDISNQS